MLLESLQATIVTSKETDRVASLKVKDIEDKLSDAKGYRERELKAATDEMKRLKKKSEESKKNWKKREQVTYRLLFIGILNWGTYQTRDVTYFL